MNLDLTTLPTDSLDVICSTLTWFDTLNMFATSTWMKFRKRMLLEMAERPDPTPSFLSVKMAKFKRLCRSVEALPFATEKQLHRTQKQETSQYRKGYKRLVKSVACIDGKIVQIDIGEIHRAEWVTGHIWCGYCYIPPHTLSSKEELKDLCKLLMIEDIDVTYRKYDMVGWDHGHVYDEEKYSNISCVEREVWTAWRVIRGYIMYVAAKKKGIQETK